MNNIIKLILGFIGVFLVVMAFVYWQLGDKTRQEVKETNHRITVVASFFPLAHFTQKISPEHVQVITMVPFNLEPHDFEPTVQDIAQVEKAQLFIFQGNGFDSGAERLAVGMDKTITLNMSQELGVDNKNPHLWLDPILAQEYVRIIKDALVSLDREHKEEYEENFMTYLKELKILDDEFMTQLTDCKFHYIVVSHDAFSHLAARYGFETIPIVGLDPREEPSAYRLREIVDMMEEKGIQYIFSEPLKSSRLARTIASQTNAQILNLNPLEGLTQEEQDAGENYLSIMKKNLKNLQLALECVS